MLEDYHLVLFYKYFDDSEHLSIIQKGINEQYRNTKFQKTTNSYLEPVIKNLQNGEEIDTKVMHNAFQQLGGSFAQREIILLGLLNHNDQFKLKKTIKNIFGQRPLGWYTGRCSPNTRELVFEEGGFLYDSDSYSDDLPYWEYRKKRKQLIVPYTLDNNDMRFVTNQGFNSGHQFFTYLKDSFDVLYEEGKNNPKMMSVGLHCRLIGRPGRIQSLKKFLDYVLKHKDVWVCKRIDIAKHWIKNYSNI